jgi:internalin A
MNDLKNLIPDVPAYYADIIAWHGYVRFLGLSTFQNNPDLSLGDLYVPHHVSEQIISPDSNPAGWSTQNPTDFLLKNRKVVVLGDPGSGKSTLLNWMSWYMASGFERRMPGAIDELLPIPIVLRDLPRGELSSIERLIELFLEMPVAESLKEYREVIFQLLQTGRLLLLIDGLDEVPADFGASVHRVVAEDPWSNYSIITSRIIGYSEYQKSSTRRGENGAHYADASNRRSSNSYSLCYVSPFDDEQISSFSRNWYREQDARRSGVDKASDEFVAAIKSDPASLRLARTPNLLTIMALIYRKLVKLPNGRALLYDEISRAYLESIDTARRLKDEFPWNVKRRWLSRIGFEMQMARAASGTADGAKELVADRKDVLSWLDDAIAQSEIDKTEGYAERYLDWITRRSGLLLPRGEGKYAFLHLSFQEYFAARYMKGQLEHPSWPRGDEADVRINRKNIKAWFNSSSWSQVFVFIFELLAGRPGWTERLLTLCPMQAAKLEQVHFINQSTASPSVVLMAELIGNPHAGFNHKLRERCFSQLLPYVETQLQYFANHVGFEGLGGVKFMLVLDKLLANPSTLELSLEWLRRTASERSTLIVSGLPKSVFDLVSSLIPKMSSLRVFAANQCEISDIEFIRGLNGLHTFSVTGCLVADASPLATISSLKKVCLSETKVADLEFVRGIDDLRSIDLDSSLVTNVAPLSCCVNLKYLDVSNTPVENMDVLSSITSLETVNLRSTNVKSLAWLNSANLQFLNVGWSMVESLDFLSNSNNLYLLFVNSTPVSDLSPIASCSKLSYLFASNSIISDIAPLKGCTSMKFLDLENCPVTDISPASSLSNLVSLDIDSCPIQDLKPLTKLKALVSLSVVGCPIIDFPKFSKRVKVRR